MNRVFSSLCMAFCSILGIFILFNVASSVLVGGLRSIVSGPPGSAIGKGLGTLIGIGLVAVALRFRRRLKTLDAGVEPHVEDSE
jgi:hypothetical protein